MSKMSDLVLDINYLLDKGQTPAQIARELEIPVVWVFEAQAFEEDTEEENSPYATINS